MSDGDPAVPSSGDGQDANAPRQVVFTVETRYQQHLAEVCDGLSRTGVVIEHVMTELGMITGTAPDAAHLAAASTVEGVASVDPSVPHHLPPPDAPVQ